MSTTRQLTTETYRGVFIEVAHPHGEPSFHQPTAYGWCGYIYLELDQVADPGLRESLWPDPVPLGFSSSDRKMVRAPSWLDDLDFHGGVTYFSKRLGLGDERGVKVGCDYRHLHDEDDLYSVESVLSDMRGVVDRLHQRTIYLMPCAGDGRLSPESEGTIPEGWDRWVSFAYMAESAFFQQHHTADGKLKGGAS